MSKSFISLEDVDGRISWAGAVDALRHGHTLSKPEASDLLIKSDAGNLFVRGAYIRELGHVVKAENLVPSNAIRGLPVSQGAVLLFHPDHGQVRAVLDSKLVTQLKTASDSVLGALLLARPDVKHLLIVGAGALAASLINAYSASFPGLENISIWARRPEQAYALAKSFPEMKPTISVVENLAKAVHRADIVSTATSSRVPLILGKWVQPGTHVDLIGSYLPDMREADDELILNARLFVDYRESTINTGDIAQPIANGVIENNHLRGDLYDLLSMEALKRSDLDITVYKNGGGAHLDLMIASYIATQAE